jgi:hypothetical protein
MRLTTFSCEGFTARCIGRFACFLLSQSWQHQELLMDAAMLRMSTAGRGRQHGDGDSSGDGAAGRNG